MKKSLLYISLSLAASLAHSAPPVATLSWTPAYFRVDGSPIVGPSTFTIYAGQGSGKEVQVLTGVAGSPINMDAVSGQTWCYQVTQVEVATGAESARSIEVCKTFPTSPPAVPTGVTVK